MRLALNQTFVGAPSLIQHSLGLYGIMPRFLVRRQLQTRLLPPMVAQPPQKSMPQAMAPSNPQHLFLLNGCGAQRWSLLQHDGDALGLPAAKAHERRVARLHRPTAQRDAERLLAWIDKQLQKGNAVAGWLGYEVGAALEGLPLARRRDPLPDADLIAFDPQHLRAQPMAEIAKTPLQHLEIPANLLTQHRDFCQNVAHALDSIGQGEIYQVNLSVRLQLPALAHLQTLSMAHLLGAVQAAQPVPMAMVFQGENYRLLSGSMERFLGVSGQTVRSRPIKGTLPRGGDGQSDAELARQLRASPKECAENTMIVDMVRNDLRRACQMGSVQVTELLTAVPYATLWHLESEVQATLQQPNNHADLLAATLPPASVTGCPKIQAIKVIQRLERSRRGPYCGALGIALPDGRAEWSVGIRQAILLPDRVVVRSGAGIVADSLPEAEWAEVCLKTQSALGVLGLLEGLPK